LSYLRTTPSGKHPFPTFAWLQASRSLAPDRVWLADITYIPTAEGWLYLAAILDMFSRRIVGWAMDDRITQELTLSALRMAIATRHLAPSSETASCLNSSVNDRRVFVAI
jgi:putative transposase